MHTHPPSPIRNRGYILVLSLVFLGIFFTTATAYLSSVTSSARAARYAVASAQALAIAEAGIDEAVYRLNQDGNFSGETTVALGAGVYTTTVTNVGTNTKRLTVTGSVPDAVYPTATRTISALVGVDTTVISFNYGVQVGAGGITMANGSKIRGNLFSNGSVSGGGIITGDATVASGTPATSLSGVTVQGSARAHTLSSCTINKDAYYQSLSGCSVSGTKYPGTADIDPGSMPILPTQISDWETIATAGGVIAGPYTVSSPITLGPKKIDGNLTVNSSLTLSGIVWVKGNITFGNGSTLTVSAATGNDGAIIMADVPGSEATLGVVDLSNNMTISGNGSAGSYPMVLSTNSGSAAITLSNNASGVILYASQGRIVINNNAEANQVTAYGITLNNNAEVEFKSGMQSQTFSNGPGGSWVILPRTYSISR